MNLTRYFICSTIWIAVYMGANYYRKTDRYARWSWAARPIKCVIQQKILLSQQCHGCRRCSARRYFQTHWKYLWRLAAMWFLIRPFQRNGRFQKFSRWKAIPNLGNSEWKCRCRSLYRIPGDPIPQWWKSTLRGRWYFHHLITVELQNCKKDLIESGLAYQQVGYQTQKFTGPISIFLFRTQLKVNEAYRVLLDNISVGPIRLFLWMSCRLRKSRH